MDCDLHVHTRASDGSLEPEQVVALARETGLKGVGITDHDTVSGISRAVDAAKGMGVRVVPGIEISTEWLDDEVHVLGYFINYQMPWLKDRLRQRQEGRIKRARKIVKRLNQLEMPVSWEQVARIAGQGAVGRPHIARAMVECGFAADINDAFVRFLNRGCPAYVPRSHLTPEEAVKIIRTAGGAPVLAHPGLIRKRGLMAPLLEIGLDGLEVYYPQHNTATVEWLLELAQEKNLIPTAGSDFHGNIGGYAPMGACRVSWDTVEKLRERATRHGSG